MIPARARYSHDSTSQHSFSLDHISVFKSKREVCIVRVTMMLTIEMLRATDNEPFVFVLTWQDIAAHLGMASLGEGLTGTSWINACLFLTRGQEGQGTLHG